MNRNSLRHLGVNVFSEMSTKCRIISDNFEPTLENIEASEAEFVVGHMKNIHDEVGYRSRTR